MVVADVRQSRPSGGCAAPLPVRLKTLLADDGEDPTRRGRDMPDESQADDPTGDAVEVGRAKAGERWPDAEQAFRDGLEVRYRMWGQDGTDAQIDAATDFTWPLQDYVTRYCFGETWTRGALDPAMRSMLTLGLLVAYGRPNEIRVHVQGAIANGVSTDQIREVMLHAMIYCGVPRAVEGFHVAQATLREMGYPV